MSEDFSTPDGDYISASQIESWRLCKRRWAWGKIDKIYGPANPAAEKGKIVHEVLEEWLKHGVVIDLDATRTLPDGTVFKPGPIAAAGLKHLPMPGTCGTERNIFVRTKVAKYQGYIDWDTKGEIPVVGDHKTTSNFKWAKTEDDLRKDPQATIYAAALMEETKKSTVELRWVYYLTSGKSQSKKVSLLVLREDIEKNFDDLDVTAAEIMHARKTVKTAKDLEPNVRSCDMFGGCQYRENCNLSSTERIKGIMAQQSLAEKMAARSAGKTPAAAGPATKTNGAAVGAGINPPEGKAPTTPADMAAAATAATAAAAPAAAAPPQVEAGKKRGRPAGTAATSAAGPTALPETTPSGGLRTAKEVWRGYAKAALSGGHDLQTAIGLANGMLDYDLSN
jgi:hypothetical protein